MDSAAASDAIRSSIQERVRAVGGGLERATPTGMVVVLAGAALWPIVAPLLGGGAAAAMLGGGIGLLQGPGQEFVSGFLKRLASRRERSDGGGAAKPSEVRAELERALLERLEAEGKEAAELRADISGLLRSVGGVEAALAAASVEVRDALLSGLADVSAQFQEFRWLLGQVEDRLQEIQRRQAQGLSMQRATLDLQREQLVKTTLLLQRHAPRSSLRRSDEDREGLTPAEDVVCPYKGLHVFESEDAGFFFGREALLADVLARLAEARFLAVVGASGSGKSSFIRAGLVPAIWRGALPDCEDARVIVFTPGDRPLDELAMRVALLRGVAAGSLLEDLRGDPRHLDLALRQAVVDAGGQARVVLVVDQLEELFTLCRDEGERRLFLDALLHAQRAPASRAVLVLAIRADFYGRLAAHTQLAGVVQDHQALVGRMSEDELRRAIEQPAAEAALSVEEGLAETMLEDLGEEPGSLPLLSHALLETWTRRRGRTLTLAGYRESGGVRGAIAQTAENVVDRFEPAQQAIARRVFLSLTEVGEDAEPTRRRVRINELVRRDESGAAMQQVLDLLADARLVTLSQDTLEMAHEALLSHWPRLRVWLEEDRESLAMHRRLSEAAREWARLTRDPGELYRGARLAAASDWAQRNAELQPFEREFLSASEKAETTELEAATRRTRRLRVLALGLGAVVVVAAIATTLAVRKTKDAQTAQRVALSRSLVADAAVNLDRDIHLAALLGLEAVRLSSEANGEPSAEGRSAVLSTLPGLEQARGRVAESSSAITLSADGRTLAAAGNDGARLWDVEARRSLPPALNHLGAVSVAFSRDGRTLASVGNNQIRLWDARARRPLGPPLKHPLVGDVTFSADGRTLASSANEFEDGTVRLWDVRARRALGPPLEDPGHGSVALSADGRTLTSASADEQKVRVWDVRARRQLRAPLTLPYTESVAFSADGRTLATASSDERIVRLWDVRTQRQLVSPLRLPYFDSVALSGDGRTLAYAGNGQVRLWDVRAHRPLGQPLTHPFVFGVALSGDGRTLASTGHGEVRIWDVRVASPLGQRLVRRFVSGVALSGDGRMLASATEGGVRLWDVRARRPLGQPLKQRLVDSVALSHDGRTLASASSEKGAVQLWDVRARRPLGQPLRVPTVSSVALSGDGATLASVSSEKGALQLWDVQARRPLGQPLKHRLVESVALSADGRTLASSGLDDHLQLWDVRARRPLGQPLRHPYVFSLAFSGDGRTLASAGDDELRLWDVRTRRPLGQPLPHVDAGSVALSGDGRTLASVGNDQMRLWDVRTRRPLGQPFPDPGAESVAFSADGRTLASAGGDGVRVWDPILWTAGGGALRRWVCPRIRPSLTRGEWSEFLPGEDYGPTCLQR